LYWVTILVVDFNLKALPFKKWRALGIVTKSQQAAQAPPEVQWCVAIRKKPGN
jgi:hypothetical protein